MSSLESAQDLLDCQPEPCNEVKTHPMDEFNQRFLKKLEEDPFKEPLTYTKYLKLCEIMRSSDCSSELREQIINIIDGSEYS